MVRINIKLGKRSPARPKDEKEREINKPNKKLERNKNIDTQERKTAMRLTAITWSSWASFLLLAPGWGAPPVDEGELFLPLGNRGVSARGDPSAAGSK